MFRGWKVPSYVAMLIPKCLTVLILPINAFGSGQAHSKSGSPDENTALVQHLFKGSWKVDHPFGGKAEKAREQSDAQQGEAESSEKSSEHGEDSNSEEKQEKKYENKQDAN